MSIREQHLELFKAAMVHLTSREETLYTQVIICQKLKTLGVQVSSSLFSKMVNTPELVGLRSVQRINEGVQELLRLELGLRYDHTKKVFVETSGRSSAKVVPAQKGNNFSNSINGLFFHADGRRSISEKVAFISQAQEEVIFLGVRLRQLVSYFTHRKDAEFKEPLLELLNRGVEVRCYLADPDHNPVRLYFSDLATALPEECFGEKAIPELITQLQKVQAEIRRSIPGAPFRIFKYRHLPTAHFLAVDTNRAQGKMLVSNYIFGVPRSKAPVIEVHRSSKLYNYYHTALEALTGGAMEVV